MRRMEPTKTNEEAEPRSPAKSVLPSTRSSYMIPKAEPEGITEVLQNIPEELRQRPQWVVWKLEKRGGKLTKVPYIARGVGRASSTDLMTWATFEEAVTAFETGRYRGVGFVFCSADPYVGIDLDDCRDAETGEIKQWAQEIIESVTDRYVEASPSGEGVHIITRGVLKEGTNTKQVEVYGQDRFFTMTGVCL
jgi:putative DNA primase/helicase